MPESTDDIAEDGGTVFTPFDSSIGGLSPLDHDVPDELEHVTVDRD
jgi:hypothetical protein